MAQQFAALGVAQFLGSYPTHSLNKSADDLAAIDAGVEGDAGVHEQIDAGDFHLAGETIDEHFAARGAVGEIEEGVALAGFTVEVDTGRDVEAALAEVDAFEIRAADELRKRHFRIGCAIVPDHAVLEDDIFRRG